MSKSAFSVVELSVVVIVIGVLAAVMVLPFYTSTRRQFKSDVYRIISDIWWVRQTAIARHNDLEMRFYNSNSYCICNGACPATEAGCRYLANSVVIAPLYNIQAAVSWSPVYKFTCNGVNGTFSDSTTITMQKSKQRANVSIYGQTGYVTENFYWQ